VNMNSGFYGLEEQLFCIKNKATHVSGVLPWLFIKRDATWAHLKIIN